MQYVLNLYNIVVVICIDLNVDISAAKFLTTFHIHIFFLFKDDNFRTKDQCPLLRETLQAYNKQTQRTDSDLD